MVLPGLFSDERPDVLGQVGHDPLEDLLRILLQQSREAQKEHGAIEVGLRVLGLLGNQFT